jgi:ABC-type multidrug transport system fused ATPase/permease subunit
LPIDNGVAEKGGVVVGQASAGRLGLWKLTKGTALSAIKQNWWRVGLIVICGALTGYAATLFSWLSSVVVDHLEDMIQRSGAGPRIFFEPGRGGSYPGDLDYPVLRGVLDLLQANGVTMLIGAAAFAVLMVALSYFAAVNRASVRAEIFSRIRNQAFERCFGEDGKLPREGDNIAGRLAISIKRGADAVSSTYSLFLNVVQQGFALVVAAVTAGWGNLPITGACLAIVLIQIIIAQGQARRMAKDREGFDSQSNSLLSEMSEVIEKRELLLASDQGPHYRGEMQQKVEKLAEIDQHLSKEESFFDALHETVQNWGRLAIIVIAGLAAVVLVSPTSAQASGQGPIVFALILYSSLIALAQSLVNSFDAYRRAESLVREFLDIIASFRQPSVANLRSESWDPDQDIIFDKVSFSYEGQSRELYSDLSLQIPAHQITLILGPSGCGKSTLARMLLGFLKPARGAIRIGGRDLSEWKPDYLLRQIGYAPQNDHILEATVRENLSWADPKRAIDEAKMISALEHVKLEANEPLEDVLKRKAQTLSLGQRQRLSAARMLLDPSNILILDEPLAGVDVITMADIVPELE